MKVQYHHLLLNQLQQTQRIISLKWNNRNFKKA